MLISESPNDLSFLDPNNWPLLPPHEFRIYGDDRLQTWAVVDEIDYHFLIQWKWSWKVSNGGKKKYLRRNVQTMIEGGSGGHYVNPETGNEVRNRLRVQQTLFLHTVVMLRKGIAPPSPAHTIVDHLDGKEENCQRYNLRWATETMNRHNRHGIHSKGVEIESSDS